MVLLTISIHLGIRIYDVDMQAPAFVPLFIAATIILVCVFAGGAAPSTFFQEWQPATVYNAVQLSFCAIVAAAIAGTRLSTPKADSSKSASLFWSIVCAACAFCSVDELFQLHETAGPMANFVRDCMGQSGRYLTIAGQHIISYGDIVQVGYFIFAGVIAWIFRKEILAHGASTWMFALAALFLTGSQVLDFGMFDGHYVWSDPNVSDGAFMTIEESFKLSGFAMVLGGLMETLLEKRQMVSVEKMLSGLSQPSTPAPSKVESLV